MSSAYAEAWSDKDRKAAVLRLLKSKSSSFECGRKCKHTVFDVREVDLGSVKKKLITARSANPQHNCHACAPELSYFFYDVNSDGWELTSSHIAFHTFGSWGDYPQEAISFVASSKTQQMLILDFGYTGQGYTEMSTTVLAPVNGQLKQVLATCSGSDNSGAIIDQSALISWVGKPAIVKPLPDTGFADIEFRVADEVSKVQSKAIFAYQNGKYSFTSGDHRMKDCTY